MTHPIGWRGTMEDLDHLRSPELISARPAGLASIGAGSYFAEPYTICFPHRVRIGSATHVAERSLMSVGGELRIGDGCLIGPDLVLRCAGEVEIGDGVGMSSRVCIGSSGGGD